MPKSKDISSGVYQITHFLSPTIMFKRSVSNETLSTHQSQGSGGTTSVEKQRVYVTSLKNIASSSPGKTSWAPPPPVSPSNSPTSSPAVRVLRKLLALPRSIRGLPSLSSDDDDDNERLISDSISDSKRLNGAIMQLTQESSIDPDSHDVVHCYKLDEATSVISTLQTKADKQINNGQLSDALSNLNKSLTLQQKLYGKRHLHVASTLNKIGEVLSNMGTDNQYMAMNALEESLDIRCEQLEPGSEEIATTLRNLWLLLHDSNHDNGVAISSTHSDDSGEEKTILTTFHDFDADNKHEFQGNGYEVFNQMQRMYGHQMKMNA